MLATDAHGGFGGISQYNRDVLEAIAGFDRVREVVVLPRIVSDPGFSAPKKVTYDLIGAAGPASFLWRSIVHGVMGGSYDLIYCAHMNLLPVAAGISYVRRVPLLLAIYGIDAWWRPSRHLVAKLATRADLVISISKITLDRFRSWSAVDERVTAVLPNAIKADRYGTGEKDQALVRRLSIEGRTVIMTLGRMSSDERYKGFDEVIEVMPRLRELEPQIAYIAVGDGDDRPRLEAKARELGVGDRVVFSGRIPEAQKSDYYRLADAYVMPSSGEGFGFVVLEALACGIPVVASIADGTREAVRDGLLGTMVDPKDPAALLAAIMDAVQRPKQVPAGLGHFSFEQFSTRLRDALGRVIDI
jgi:glycosyltransferase involved in cell wall biosynthesis